MMISLKSIPPGRALAAGMLATTMLAAPLVIAAERTVDRPAISVQGSQKPADFSAVIKAVRPAVVSIHVERSIAPIAFERAPGMPDFGDSHPFDFFYKRHGHGKPWSSPGPVKGVGSGFFISADGYIVTNNHVIDAAEKIEVRTDGGDAIEAKLVGADPKTDLALLKVAGEDFPHVAFADGGPTVGQWVLTVGSPFGLGGSVTAGIVSADGRDIGSGLYGDYLQIDAPINRGNSGGPAFDLDGKVIGVNTAILSPHGGNAGVGFAIPAKIAGMVVSDLKDDGRIDRGWLGVQIQPMTDDLAHALGVEELEGALVSSVSEGSPAAKAGIRPGDLIIAVDDAYIETPRDLARIIAEAGAERTVELSLVRDRNLFKKVVPLGATPETRLQADTEPDADSDKPRLGLALVDGDGNAVVTAVKPGSEAHKKGIRPGTTILGVGGKKVTSAADVVTAVAEAHNKGDDVVLMQVETKLGRHFVALDLRGNA